MLSPAALTAEGRVNRRMPTQFFKTVGKSEVRGGTQFFAQGVQRSTADVPATRLEQCPHCFRKITRRGTATRQVKLESGRGRSQLRGGTLCRGPRGGSGNRVGAHPLARPLGRRRETSRQELAAVPSAWGWRSAPGTFEGDAPQTRASRWRHGPHNRVPPRAAREERSRRTREAAAPGSAGPNQHGSVRGRRGVPNPERAPVFVNKPITWPGQPAPRPRRPGNARGAPRGTSPASPQPSRAARCAGARWCPGRTALPRVDGAPRPREPSSRFSPTLTWRRAAGSGRRRARLLRSARRGRTARLTPALPARS